MKSFFKILFFLFIIKNTLAQDITNIVNLELKDGTVVIEMKPDHAPEHVKRIKELISEKFYDGLKFHRVITGFMAQTGDPRGDGTGGSGQNIPAEFNSLPHIRGTVSMARAQDPDSADSQFFICFQTSSSLDGQYTVWGQVIEGMEFVDKIKRGSGSNGMVDEPDKIISMRMAKDVKQ
jgi:peptidylprolyl isomerase